MTDDIVDAESVKLCVLHYDFDGSFDSSFDATGTVTLPLLAHVILTRKYRVLRVTQSVT